MNLTLYCPELFSEHNDIGLTKHKCSLVFSPIEKQKVKHLLVLTIR